MQQHQYLALQCKYLWKNRVGDFLPFCIITEKLQAETCGHHLNWFPV